MGKTRPELPIWIDDALRERSDPALRADDSAAVEGRGCYTTTRVVAGRPRWIDRHVERLARDARTLGLGAIDRERARRALVETAEAAFGEGDGAVRLQASRDGTGRVHLLGLPRSLGDEPDTWRAVTAGGAHPGPMPWGGAKVTNHLPMGWARDDATRSGVDEALLFDRDGFAVEGTRCNLLFRGPDGELRAVDPRRGAVAGIALEVLGERMPDLPRGDLARADIGEVTELIGINGLRGARAIVELDGRAVGDGRAGDGCRRVADCLDLV